LRAMSGFAGQSLSRKLRPESSTSNGYARSLKKECAALAAGQVAFIVEIIEYAQISNET